MMDKRLHDEDHLFLYKAKTVFNKAFLMMVDVPDNENDPVMPVRAWRAAAHAVAVFRSQPAHQKLKTIAQGMGVAAAVVTLPFALKAGYDVFSSAPQPLPGTIICGVMASAFAGGVVEEVVRRAGLLWPHTRKIGVDAHDPP